MQQDKNSAFYPPTAPPFEGGDTTSCWRPEAPPPSYSSNKNNPPGMSPVPLNCSRASIRLSNSLFTGAHVGSVRAPPPPYRPYANPGPEGLPYPAYPTGPYNVPPRQPSPSYGYPSMGPQGPPPPLGPHPQPGTVVIQMPISQGQFDAGARFHPMAPPSIPPPPPGCIPNSAQVSVMQGHAPPQVQQTKGGFWKGSGGGGYTFW